MPVGPSLAEAIESLMDQEASGRRFEGPISNVLMRNGGLGETEVRAITRVRQGIVSKESIDDFVDEWKDIPRLQDVAKLGITQAILTGERHTTWGQAAYNAISKSHALRRSRESWLGKILRLHNRTTARRAFLETMSDIAFVVFNYDRLIEYHLYHYLTIALDVPESEAREVLRTVPIIHVYGPVGELPELGGRHPFGRSEPQTLAHSAGMIRTYTETVESLTGDAIIRLMSGAQKVVFLGAAYHSQNLKLLFPETAMLKTKDAPKIFGTVYGMRGPRVDEVHTFFENPFKESVFKNETAGGFIDAMQDSLFA
jgi:hypothetical protein